LTVLLQNMSSSAF